MTTWNGCYAEQWGGELVPEAFKHPAKVAPGLAKRIYDYMLENGWLHAGQQVVDPFGGIGGFALQAILHKLNFTGVELEPKFAQLAGENIALWKRMYGALPGLGTARVLQGDSRYLADVIQAADGAVSSPPYAETEISHERNFKSRFNPDGIEARQSTHSGYSGAVSSPPYASTRIDGQGDEGSSGITMPDGTYPRGAEGWELRKSIGGRYGDNEGQLANETGETFWQSARTILEQVHQVLTPGAYTAWVCKDYVKNKQVAPFCNQWRELCEAAGFTHVETILVSLVRETHVGNDLFSGDAVIKRTERKSFFRRLAEKNGSPRIDFEQVLVMRKEG